MAGSALMAACIHDQMACTMQLVRRQVDGGSNGSTFSTLHRRRTRAWTAAALARRSQTGGGQVYSGGQLDGGTVIG